VNRLIVDWLRHWFTPVRGLRLRPIGA
jgi:hypothetical protein